MAAFIDSWWLSVKAEYAQDETDKYKAYAKTIILNWANRILFAHIIKHKQNGAMIVDEIDYDKTPNEANAIFKKITEKCDFYNVFSAVRYNEALPELSWQDFETVITPFFKSTSSHVRASSSPIRNPV